MSGGERQPASPAHPTNKCQVFPRTKGLLAALSPTVAACRHYFVQRPSE